jgi:hypothetical protein
MQTCEQLAAFRHLCQANHLGKAEVWQHKQSGNWIIGRAGIEKIQGLNNIQLTIELAAAGVDFAVVKATATRSIKGEGKTAAKKLSVQSLGSANAKNSQVSYYAEMAEKRAKSRAILLLMGFYELGVYGEEEADDFQQGRNIGAPTLEEVAPRTAPVLVPGKQEPEAVVLGRALARQQACAGASPSIVAPNKAPEAQLQQLVRLMASPELDQEERDVLLSMPVDQRPAAWIENTLTKLSAVLAERQDPKRALAAARTQLRTVAARFQKEMPEAAYQALLRRAQALTAKPEQLRAEARQVLAQFQSAP